MPGAHFLDDELLADLRAMRRDWKVRRPAMRRTKWPYLSSGGGGRLLRAVGDIANGGTSADNANLVTLDGATPTETSTSVTVVNFLLPKIWDNSYMTAQQLGGELVIVKAYSALWLNCLVNEGSGVATGDATFAVDNITALDGHFESTSIAAVRNEYSDAIANNAIISVKWDDSVAQEWQTAQVSCAS